MQMAAIFAIMVFIIMSITMILVALILHLLRSLGIHLHLAERAPLLIFSISCLIVGTVLSTIISHFPLRPVRRVIAAIDQLADGDFSARLNLKGPDEINHLTQSFNHMAEELSSIEMLRSDFVNNFSHEFKTPIVSISGFARILQRKDLTEEERDEYLRIIISESDRLAELATNVLNLSKLENQQILTNITHFNLSEQIRRCVVLLEKKWNAKHQDIVFEAKEYYISADEELLNQVWINLLDNAIKFSRAYATITLEIIQNESESCISVKNEGSGFDENTALHIFDKFYQGDTSHSAKGNGLGLTLVKRIVEMHGGRITVESVPDVETVFRVYLPGR